MKIKKLIVILAVIAAAVIGLFFAARFMKNKIGNSGSEVHVQSVDSVNSADNTSANRFGGMVETQKKEGVKADANLTIKECYVKEGDHVNEGDKLFAYDTTTTDLEIKQKEVGVEKLNSTIENNNGQIAVLTEKMSKAQASEQVELSSAILELQTENAQAEYDIKVAKAEIDKLKASMDNSVVKAPITGVVTSIKDPLINTDENSDYITVTAEGKFRVKGKLNEQNINNVYEGENVILRSRVDENKTWKGVVSLIDTSKPDENNNGGGYYDTSGGMSSSSSYAFYVEPENVDGLMLGQHLIIEEDFGSEKLEGIWLESGWLMFEEDGTYCWASSSSDGNIEKRKVETGKTLEERGLYQIVSGLSEDEYIAWPDAGIEAGMKVTTLKQVQSEETPEGEGGTEDVMNPEGTMNPETVIGNGAVEAAAE